MIEIKAPEVILRNEKRMLQEAVDLSLIHILKLTENYTSEGVKDYMGADIISKGARFSASDFTDSDGELLAFQLGIEFLVLLDEVHHQCTCLLYTSRCV